MFDAGLQGGGCRFRAVPPLPPLGVPRSACSHTAGFVKCGSPFTCSLVRPLPPGSFPCAHTAHTLNKRDINVNLYSKQIHLRHSRRCRYADEPFAPSCARAHHALCYTHSLT